MAGRVPERRAIFSELVSPERVASRETLALLAEREILLYLAVTPEVRSRAVEMVRACRDAGVSVGVWPMIDDRRGRWASAWTGVELGEYTRALLGELDAAGAPADELLVDLEPPIDLAKLVLRGRPTIQGPPPRVGARALRALVEEVDRAGLPVTATVHPWAVCGRGAVGWQRAMGTPVDGLPFRRVFVMAYTSLVEGYSRRLLRRRDAEALLFRWVDAARRRLGPRAAAALGVVGIGALGDERCYRDPSELAGDVAIARAAGADEIALFNLGGALDRPPAARWLDALCADTEPAPAPRTLRASASLAVVDTGGRLLEQLLRRRR